MPDINVKAAIFTGLGFAAVVGLAVGAYKLWQKKHTPEEQDDILEDEDDEFELTPEMFGQDGDTDGDPRPVNPRFVDFSTIAIPEETEELKVIPSSVQKMPLEEAVRMYVDGYSQETSMVVLTKEEFDEAVDEEHRHGCTYFELDDILAGFDDKLDEIDPSTELYQVAVNALMNQGVSQAFVYDEVTGEGYEVIASENNYLEALEELGIDISRISTEEDDG